jgi:hypothetical protein
MIQQMRRTRRAKETSKRGSKRAKRNSTRRKRTSKQSGGLNISRIRQIVNKRIHAAELANVSRNVTQRLQNKLQS